MAILPILLEAFHEALTIELAAIMAMAATGTFLLTLSTASLLLAFRGQ